MYHLSAVTYADIRPQRKAYLKQAVVPLDGMWEDAFFAHGTHFHILHGERVLGYIGVNEDNALLGFQCFDAVHASTAFSHSLRDKNINRAFVSTAEPLYLSLCLDHLDDMKINALMYEDSGAVVTPPEFPSDTLYRRVTIADFELAVAFGVEAIGADEAWLKGYYGERIQQEELFALWRGDEILAAGELRISPSQSGIADVGMVVAPPHRKQGIATQILKRLRHDAADRGLRAICSTEQENVGAQRAIEAAGFYSSHRILDITLQ